MLMLAPLAAVAASLGWATGIVLAHRPAKQLGAFEFTRIQLIACSAILAALCTGLGFWPSVVWDYWPSYALSVGFGIVLGNLAMIECLRRAGPRRTELLLALKAPLVAAMAFFWLQEIPSTLDLFGACLTLAGVCVAILSGSKVPKAREPSSEPFVAILLLGVAAAGFQGFGFLVMKPAMLAGTEPLAASALRLLGAAFLISLIALWPARVLGARSALSPSLLGRTILPGFIGYGVSSSLLLYAFANFDAGIAAALGSLSPVLVLPILWFKDGIAPDAKAIFGALLAVAGTTIIVIA